MSQPSDAHGLAAAIAMRLKDGSGADLRALQNALLLVVAATGNFPPYAAHGFCEPIPPRPQTAQGSLEIGPRRDQFSVSGGSGFRAHRSCQRDERLHARTPRVTW